MRQREAQALIAEGKKCQEVRRRLRSRTPVAAKLKRRSEEALAYEVVPTAFLPHPIYVDSASGGQMTDVDGNTYIDMTMGFGPYVLGHRPASVLAAFEAQSRKGWHFGFPGAPQIELGELLGEASPCADQVIFCQSGTEANMYAMRAARAFTGKPRVAMFDGCYHGAHDYALIHADPRSARSRPEGKALGSGVPEAIREQTMLVLPFRETAAFDLVREHRGELAAVFVEGAQNRVPRLDCGDFLAELLAVCRESDVLLCFDEVVTGFRVAYGGAQEHYGITPDLATYGKAISHGVPVGAIAGRRDVMDCFSGKGRAPVFSGGTFSGNPLVMAAGVAALTEMRDTKDTLYPYLMEQGNGLALTINRFCEAQDLPMQITNAGSLLHLHFQRDPVYAVRDLTGEVPHVVEREFYLHLMGHGVLIPGSHPAYLCAAHTPEDVDRIAEAMKQSLLDLREDGLI